MTPARPLFALKEIYMYQVTNYGMCGECKHHKYDKESDGSWVCTNDRSEYFADWTEYTDRCDEWEEKK